jgi:hypothetical protein
VGSHYRVVRVTGLYKDRLPLCSFFFIFFVFFVPDQTYKYLIRLRCPYALLYASGDTVPFDFYLCRYIVLRKLGKKLTEKQDDLLAKLICKDKNWTEIGEHFPGYTLQLLKKNFFGKQGGKPWRRGRKPGVRITVV